MKFREHIKIVFRATPQRCEVIPSNKSVNAPGETIAHTFITESDFSAASETNSRFGKRETKCRDGA